MKLACLSLLVTLCHAAWNQRGTTPKDTGSTVVISTALKNDPYYNQPGDKNRYGDIYDFHAKFAQKLHDAGINVIVATDKNTGYGLRDEKGIPQDVIWRPKEPIAGVWMRDMTRAGKYSQTGYKYRPKYIKKASDAEWIQNTFDWAASNASMTFNPRYPEVVDAGNVVDNFKGLAVVTSRVLEDAGKKYTPENVKAAEEKMEQELNYEKVCVIPEIKGDTTGHSDGMVSFISEKVLAYSEFDPDLDDSYGGKIAETMVAKLKQCFDDKGVTLLKLPYKYPQSAGGRGDADAFKFTSACGTHVNALYTGDKLIVPIFGKDELNDLDGLKTEMDDKNVAAIKKAIADAGSKVEVFTITVPKRVCMLGGNVRCLSWLVAGENADKLIKHVQDEKWY